jgi:hypothetical protein
MQTLRKLLLKHVLRICLKDVPDYTQAGGESNWSVFVNRKYQHYLFYKQDFRKCRGYTQPPDEQLLN